MVRRGNTGGNGNAETRPKRAPGRRRLTLAIGALLIVEAGAIGLKAWDEHTTRDLHGLESLQREAEALGERLDGQSANVASIVALGQRAGAGRSLIVDSLASVDAVLTLRDASSSPDGSRIKLAADTAVRLITRGETVGISETGDVIVVVSQTGFPTTIAFSTGEAWLPAANAGERYTLAGDVRYGVGDAALAAIADTATLDQPHIQASDNHTRAATACATLAGTSMRACVSRTAPALSGWDLMRWASYGLLLAAPVLAILGLFGMTLRSRTERDAAAGDAATARSQLDLVMSGAKAGSWTFNTASRTIELSPMAGDLVGLPADQVHTVEELLECAGEASRPALYEALQQAESKGWLQATFSTIRTADAGFVEMRASPIEGRENSDELSGIVIDVTEQRRADARVRMAEKRLRNAIEGVNNPFALWDERGRLLYWNRSYASTFNLGDTLRPGIGRDTVKMASAAAIRSEKISTDNRDGTLIELYTGQWLQLVERATAEDGMITLALDVTDTVKSKNQLERQKRKLKTVISELERSEGYAKELANKYEEEKVRAEHAANSKSDFLANMSHELRTPLNAINGFSEILVEELYGPLGNEKYKGYAEDIHASGQHLLELINDILDMAKIEAGKLSMSLETLDPTDPVDAAVRILRQNAEGKGVDLILDAPSDLPEIRADHRAIRQMVLNLVSNALKFTDEGGRVTVALRMREDELQISVTDNGIGIPRDKIAKLGRPFEQIADTRDRNVEGTGLGLALTKSFAEMHGGRIGIASEVGRGTRVSIYLPVTLAVSDSDEGDADYRAIASGE